MDDMKPEPRWEGSVPLCVEECRHHDGKRCKLTGFRPDMICEPAVQELVGVLKNQLLKAEACSKPATS